jgi:hypothetical protein
MTRYHLKSLAFALGLGLLSGCCGFEIGNGQLLSRFHRRGPCDCSTVGNGPMVLDGNGHPIDGPILEPQGPTIQPPGVTTEPPIAPPPRTFPPQAQPTPAGPVSKAKLFDPGK